MANEELISEFERRELETIEIALTAKIGRTAITIDEFIQIQLKQGNSLQSIKALLLDDLVNNGRMFSEFRRAVKATAKGSVNRIRDSYLYSEHGVDRNYRWVAVLVNTCPDCLANHGKSMTWDEWEGSSFGLPRSGGTICRENCRCMLIISESVEIQPLIRRSRNKVINPRTGRSIKVS